MIDDDVLTYERVKKKGYVRLVTNKGSLNLELHCEMVSGFFKEFVALKQSPTLPKKKKKKFFFQRCLLIRSAIVWYTNLKIFIRGH